MTCVDDRISTYWATSINQVYYFKSVIALNIQLELATCYEHYLMTAIPCLKYSGAIFMILLREFIV